MSATKLTKTELADRAALWYVRDNRLTVRSDIRRATSQATLNRLLRRGWITLPDGAEYTDQVALTWDGEDYLTELEQPWITN